MWYNCGMSKEKKIHFTSRLHPEYISLIKKIACDSTASHSEVIEYALGYAFGYQRKIECQKNEPVGGRMSTNKDRVLWNVNNILSQADECEEKFRLRVRDRERDERLFDEPDMTDYTEMERIREDEV